MNPTSSDQPSPPPPPSLEGDRAIRAITDDGAFRVVAICTTETVREAVRAQGVDGPEAREEARVFADLLTGTILIRETMAPDLRVQAILQGSDRASRMVGDAHPDDTSRGLVQLAKGGGASRFKKGALLQVARTLHNGALHQGVVQVPDGGSISGALMSYMQDSEQVVSIVSVGAVFGPDGQIASAGGYILQLLPEVGEGPLMVMTERMREFESIEPLLAAGHASPEELLEEILYGMPFTRVGEKTLRFGCNCSLTRVTTSLATLPRHDIQEFIDDGRVLEIGCDYCGKQYRVPPEHLRGLLEAH